MYLHINIVCARVCVCVLIKGSIYCSCCRILSPPPASPSLCFWTGDNEWRWEGSSTNATPFITHVKQLDQLLGTSGKKLAFHPSPFLSLCLSQPLSLYISVIAPRLINDSGSHLIFHLFGLKRGVIDQHFELCFTEQTSLPVNMQVFFDKTTIPVLLSP